MEKLNKILSDVKKASYELQTLNTNQKNEMIINIAKALIKNKNIILNANKLDIDNAINNSLTSAMINRLELNENKILSIANDMIKISNLNDPIGEIIETYNHPNGLVIKKERVPFGVICAIFESRPNVTADVFALCFKTSNAVILKGGSDAINSNKAIVNIIKAALEEVGITADAITLIEDTDRESLAEFMKLDEYVDVLIPRGGKGLISAVKNNSTIPVIETGTGNCHIYVDSFADIDMAIRIIINAKTQRLGVCNAAESLVIHKDILDEIITRLVDDLRKKDIEIRADKYIVDKYPNLKLNIATEEDYTTEYLDKIISIKVVESIEDAIEHINRCSTKHSEAIITKDYDNANMFHTYIDSAAVYVNASTRFTDGFEFGFGAEIGISTQKLHARGPMGLKALTCEKYIIYGEGQVRR